MSSTTSSIEDDGYVMYTDDGCSQAIRFTNVTENETFAFSLIIVRGFVIRNGDQCDDNCENLVIRRLRRNRGPEEFNCRLKYNKFSVLLHLEAGENHFSFCISRHTTNRTYIYERSVNYLTVTPVYIVCRNEHELSDTDGDHRDICAKISTGCRLIQTLIAESLFQNGHRRKTFSLDGDDANGNDSCLIFKSNLHADAVSEMSSEDLWQYFGRELMTSEYGSSRRKFVAFATDRNGNRKKHIAIGGGGLALCDIKFLESWPITVDDVWRYFGYSDVDVNSNDWQRRFTSFSVSLGAVCHELCHTFDLGHTVSGIMGKDYDRVSRLFLVTDQQVAASPLAVTNVNCETTKMDSLVVSAGTTKRTLNINYSVNSHLTSNAAEKSVDCEGGRILKNVSGELNFWSNGCATLLAYHRWIQGNNIDDYPVYSNVNSTNNALHYDHVRGIITSTRGIVVVQLRRICGYVLKSWEFNGKRKKTLFLVPLYEARRASVIVVEDVDGNLFKKELQNLF